MKWSLTASLGNTDLWCLVIENHLKSGGLLGPLLCGLALALRQIPCELSRQMVLFHMVSRWRSSNQEGSLSRSRKAPISNLCCRVATFLWEPTRGWCPNRNTRFLLPPWASLNTEGERSLEFAIANGLRLGKAWFKKSNTPDHIQLWWPLNPNRLHTLPQEFRQCSQQRESHP